MEVMVAAAASPTGSPTRDPFNFKPYLSAPSSPKRYVEDFYLSAPSSPTSFHNQLDSYFSEFPPSAYDWELKSGEKSNLDGDYDDADGGFAFFVSGASETPSRCAAELFHGGKIKPLKDEFVGSAKSPLLSPRRSSPIAKGKKAVIEAFSPKKKKEGESGGGERRGRDRSPAAGADSSSPASRSGRRVTRSLSPYRVSDHAWDEEQQDQSNKKKEDSNAIPTTAASISSISSKGSGRKWRLRDFLLFRSASEGRGSSTDPLRKFPLFYRKGEEVKVGSSSSTSTSFRGSEIPRTRRKEPISAHELHYARKRAETEDLKKKTFLPYKHGILGRLAGRGSSSR